MSARSLLASVAVAVAACTLGLPVAAQTSPPAPPAPPRPPAPAWIAPDGSEVAGIRGTFEVPEDRGEPASGTLQLAYLRVPTSAARAAAPIVYLAGGPGASGIEAARGPRAAFFQRLAAVADVVLLDQRGTGASRPALVCNQSWRHPHDQPLSEEGAIAAVVQAARECASQMSARGVRLSAYNLQEMADDVEALRRALGAEKVSLVASSFGTRLALEVLRRHPGSVDRAVLLGVVGPDRVLKSPRAVDEVLARIETGGRSNLAADLRRSAARLAERPASVSAVDLLSGQEVELAAGGFDLRLATSRYLGTAADLLQLREMTRRLLEGDLRPLSQDLLRMRKGWLGHAMPYAVTCSAGASPERARTIDGEAAEAPFGPLLDFGFPEICEALGVGPADDAVRQPVRSDVPVLLVSGTLDTRTPVANAEEVLAGLSRGAHLVVEAAGHGDDLMLSTPDIGRRLAAFLGGAEAESARLAALPPWRSPPPPPATRAQPVTEVLHGVAVDDPFRWLEDSASPETRIWVDQQNAYADRLLAVLPGRAELRRRLGELLAGGEAVGRPRVRGERAIFRRADAADRLARVVMRDGAGTERVLLDPAELDPEQRIDAPVLDLSRDGTLFAHGVRRDGAEEMAVRFRAVDGAPLADELPAGRYFGVAVAPDGRGAYYSREHDTLDGAGYYYHRFGTDPADDRMLFGEGYDQGSVVWGNVSDDGRWLVLHGVWGTRRQIDVFLDRLEPADPVTGHDLSSRREVVSGVDAAFYAGVLGDRLVIHTTWQAPRGRVLVAPLDRPGRESWREIVPEHPSAVVETVFGAGGRLVVELLDEIQSRLAVYDLDGRHLADVPLPGPGNVTGISGHWERQELYFTFTSFHLPPTVYRYDLASGDLSPWNPGASAGLESDAYRVQQVWYPSRDGARVPMFVVHRAGLELDGSHPTLVTAYGGFATSLTPDFDPLAALWVERGGVYAVANVRGGGELGAEWHQAAVREHKQRSIDDLLAALDWLVAKGYTRRERLAVSGHSNGGLLAAAAMVQEPAAMRAVVSTHPLLDMLRYHRFGAARFWLPEYGSPERPEAFPYLRAYSPYHRVEAGVRYPATFLMTSYGDTQVAPLHARKMAARLQAVAAPDRPVVLRHYRDVGHGGAGVTTAHRLDELTDILSFLLWQLGETP